MHIILCCGFFCTHRKCTTIKSLRKAMDNHCKRVQKTIDSGPSSKAINQSKSRKLPLQTELSSPGLEKGTYDEASDLEPTRHKVSEDRGWDNVHLIPQFYLPRSQLTYFTSYGTVS